MRLWIVMARWSATMPWEPYAVFKSLEAATVWMRERFSGTVAERRVQKARLER